LHKLAVLENITVREALKALNTTGEGIICIVDHQDKLVGILTDGDVRRAVIDGVSLDTSIEKIINHDFKAWDGEGEQKALAYMKAQKLRCLPVIDPQGKLLDVILMDDVDFCMKDNQVVLMAGGYGKRLRPLTDKAPKPMLMVGDKPFLQYILEDFISQGFHDFYFCVHYLANQLKDYFGNGSQRGITINYIDEKEPLGTAGALAYLPIKSDLPVIVMNSDLITKVDFGSLLDFHGKENNIATVCTYEYTYQVPFGVIERNERHNVLTINEKPIFTHQINAGIYVLNTECLKLIPKGKAYSLPALINKIARRVSMFPLKDYWLDIGNLRDYEIARELTNV
jgi:dTDP-glucose pyrophosphorylase